MKPVPVVGATRLGELTVSRLGLGCMVMTRSYAPVDVDEARATFDRALELGITLLDTANSYAAGENEEFVGAALAGRRDDVVLASKFGLVVNADGALVVNGRPEHVKQSCEESLRRLGVDHLDLYYQHRVAPDVPIEETVGAMGELVASGKVRYLGLSEPTADELRRAHVVHPITAVQSEWSLWARQLEDDVVPTARSLGVGIVPYSPLGRGFLAGAITAANLDSDDLRAPDPRLQGRNLEQNLRLVSVLKEIAAATGATPAQVALAWLLAQGPDVVPIPGVERRSLLEENVGAIGLELSAADLATLDAAFPPGVAAGNPDELLLRARPRTTGADHDR